MRSLFLSLIVSALLVGQVGCSDKKFDRVPITGQVLVDGQPLAHGRVEVTPHGARPAYGTLDSDGKFTLTTFKEGDGTVPGVHPVMVIAVEHLDGFRNKWHAPKKYASTSAGLTLEVDPKVPNPTIELHWDGGKPFVERNDVD